MGLLTKHTGEKIIHPVTKVKKFWEKLNLIMYIANITSTNKETKILTTGWVSFPST